MFTLNNSYYQKHFTLSTILIIEIIHACFNKSNPPELLNMYYLSKHSIKIAWSPIMRWAFFRSETIEVNQVPAHRSSCASKRDTQTGTRSHEDKCNEEK